MIPGTAIPFTRLSVDDTLQPAGTTHKLTDALSDFQPGQRLVATIQSQLANGTYRAIVAQRDVTLALPFAAKAGDQLKLEVVDTRGRITFALAKDAPAAAPAPNASAPTTLSQAGQIIGTLFAKPTGAQGEAAPVPLNRGQPLAPPPEENGAQLAPQLQKAVAQSGVFFEAHLAAWVAGRLGKSELLREPLANLPRPTDGRADGGARAPAAATMANSGAPTTGQPSSIPAGTPAAQAAGTAPANAGTAATNAGTAAATPGAARTATGGSAGAVLPGSLATVGASSEAAGRGAMPPLNLSPEAATMVHQQLNALATNVYAWQGLPWQNQRLEWEIVDADGRPRGADDQEARQWQTRLALTLPALGEIEALIQLDGKNFQVSFRAPRADTRAALGGALDSLRGHFSALGLTLAQVAIDAPETGTPGPGETHTGSADGPGTA